MQLHGRPDFYHRTTSLVSRALVPTFVAIAFLLAWCTQPRALVGSDALRALRWTPPARGDTTREITAVPNTRMRRPTSLVPRAALSSTPQTRHCYDYPMYQSMQEHVRICELR